MNFTYGCRDRSIACDFTREADVARGARVVDTCSFRVTSEGVRLNSIRCHCRGHLSMKPVPHCSCLTSRDATTSHCLAKHIQRWCLRNVMPIREQCQLLVVPSKFTASLTAHADNLAKRKRLPRLHLKPEDGGTICQVLRESHGVLTFLMASAVSNTVWLPSSSGAKGGDAGHGVL